MNTPDRPSRSPKHEGTTRYSRALIEASGPVPYERVDWTEFHATLAARAELSLARLRHPHLAEHSPSRLVVALANDAPVLAWWQYAARWSRLVVSASIAAGIALIMVVRSSPKDMSETVVASAAEVPYQVDGTRAVFESAALGRGSNWTMDSALLPSISELLIPLGKRDGSR
ncbi:MAG TPA: hypothetical protein VL308_16595 [Gemmatimonadaceae bacterium]|nr:hypothetical protein [Gemmatimonadaceae bacterium]